MDTRLKPSGFNLPIPTEQTPFSEYLINTRAVLTEFYQSNYPDQIDLRLKANSPYELQPNNVKRHPVSGKWPRAVLLTHGVSDGTYSLQNIAQFFQQQGMLVRTILLPGHGTQPGDLCGVSRHDWLKLCEYGLASLQHDAEDVYLSGYSIGSVLSCLVSQMSSQIKGLILFAPAFKIRSPLVCLTPFLNPFASRWPNLFGWIGKFSETDIGAYQSFPVNAAYQCYRLTQQLQKQLQRQGLNIPQFIVAAETDETISGPYALTHFNRYSNASSRCIYYSSQQTPKTHDQLTVRSSHFPEHNILNFSHLGLATAPEHEYYGIQGDYSGFLHYQWRHPNWQAPANATIYQGAVNRANLKTGIIKRLAYNPDYAWLTHELGCWLSEQ